MRHFVTAAIHSPAECEFRVGSVVLTNSFEFAVEVDFVVQPVFANQQIEALADHVVRQRNGQLATVDSPVSKTDITFVVHVQMNGPFHACLERLKQRHLMRLDDCVRRGKVVPRTDLPAWPPRFNSRREFSFVLDVFLVFKQPEYLCVAVFLVPPRPLVKVTSRNRQVADGVDSDVLPNRSLTVDALLHNIVVNIDYGSRDADRGIKSRWQRAAVNQLLKCGVRSRLRVQIVDCRCRIVGVVNRASDGMIDRRAVLALIICVVNRPHCNRLRCGVSETQHLCRREIHAVGADLGLCVGRGCDFDRTGGNCVQSDVVSIDGAGLADRDPFSRGGDSDMMKLRVSATLGICVETVVFGEVQCFGRRSNQASVSE